MEEEPRQTKIEERGCDEMSLISDTNDHNHHPQPDTLNHGEVEASRISSKQSSADKITRGKESGYESREPEHRILAEAAQAFAEAFKNEIQSTLANERVSDAPNSDSSSNSITRPNNYNYFTPKNINSCILSSENTRVVCSITIALLVVFSNNNISHRNIVKSQSIIASRPLYVLLLTDVSIVVARLILARRQGKNKSKKDEESRLPDPDNWDDAVKVLEIGLVLYQAIRGLFIDCSFYMVIVICGLSL